MIENIADPASSAIGVFDSGVGGLSVLASIRSLLPGEDLIYVADSAHAPYGDKSEAELLRRVEQICAYLERSQVKAMVVACNTATAATVERLRAHHRVPIIAIEPGIKPAVAISRNGRIGVMATRHMLASSRYRRLLQDFTGDARIFSRACPGLVEEIEAGHLDAPRTTALLRRYLEPMLSENIDTLVLGCTHYPLLRPQIAGICGPDVTLLDTGEPVARQLQARLMQAGLARKQGSGQERFVTSGSPEAFAAQIRRLYDEDQQSVREVQRLD